MLSQLDYSPEDLHPLSASQRFCRLKKITFSAYILRWSWFDYKIVKDLCCNFFEDHLWFGVVWEFLNSFEITNIRNIFWGKKIQNINLTYLFLNIMTLDKPSRLNFHEIAEHCKSAIFTLRFPTLIFLNLRSFTFKI